MYVDKRKHTGLWAACAVLLAVLILAVCLFFQKGLDEDVQRETEYAIRDTIRRTALQCFAVEGVYPESLDYLKENYGLRVNTTDYYVVYEVFADNLPPNIRVARKGG